VLDIHAVNKNTIKVIINADDFGYTKGINRAIIDSHAKGITSSATLMANAPAFDDAVRLAKSNPRLGVGVHLTAVEFMPITQDLKHIANEKGKFHSYTKLSQLLADKSISPMVLEELESEFDAQIQKCLSTGLNITHLDSHQHFAVKDEVIDLFIQIGKKYKLPVRSFGKRSNIEAVDHCFSGTGLKSVNAIIWAIELCRETERQIIEMYWHPGYIDDEYMRVASESENFRRQRKKDTQNACSSKLLRYLQESHIELVTYGEFAKIEKFPFPFQTTSVAKKIVPFDIAANRVNTYAQWFDAEKYLTIGLSEGGKFFSTNLPLKIAVDPEFRFEPAQHAQHGALCLSITADEFFAAFPEHPQASLYLEPDGRIAFDIIHIGGALTFEQSLRAFENSRKICHKNTLWILDDTVSSDGARHGDRFKTLFAVHDCHPDISYCTMTGGGNAQTVLWQAPALSERKPRFASLQEITVLEDSAALRHADLFVRVDDELVSVLIGKSLAPAA